MTSQGKFEFRRMPFGMCNAPASFRRAMDIVLRDCQDCSSAYSDDIIMYSCSWEHHFDKFVLSVGGFESGRVNCQEKEE